VDQGYRNVEKHVYQTNTWSAAFFMRDTKTLVTIPSDLGILQTTTFTPWYDCGLSIISISLNTPPNSMDEFKHVARRWQCFDMDEVSSASILFAEKITIVAALLLHNFF
jgi:hypothetical protein